MQRGFRVLSRALTARGRRASVCWAAACVLLTALPGLLALEEAFSSRYVIQDDARQHVFWMQQYVEPNLFVGWGVADYFRSVAPPGYAGLYRAFAYLGVHPLLLAKLIPLFLSLATAVACFLLVRRATGLPSSGFAVAFVLVQNLWLLDALSNATPRAFLYPLFLGGLWALDRRSVAGSAFTAALLALFYPALLFVFLGTTLLLAVSRGGAYRLIAAAGVGAGFAAILPFALSSHVYGPILSGAAAARLPELQAGGRSAFFDPDPLRFWLCGERSGLLPIEWCEAGRRLPAGAPVLVVPIALILLVAHELRRRRSVWRPVVTASIGLFLAAHALLFRLHLPNRYTQHTLRILFAVAAGGLIVRGFIFASARAERGGPLLRTATVAVALCVAALMLVAPFATRSVAWHGYVTGRHSALYDFLRQRPPDTLVASIDREADNLPSFAQRPVLVAREYAIPFHIGYYAPFRRRAVALVTAQYSDDPRAVHAFISGFHVDYWLLHDDAFSVRYLRDAWRRGLTPAVDRARALLRAGRAPFLARVRGACTVLEDGDLSLLDAECIDDLAEREAP